LKARDELDTLPYTTLVNQSLSGVSLAIKRQLNRLIVDKSPLNLGVLFPIQGANIRLKSALYRLDSVMPQSFKTALDRKLKTTISKIVGDRYQQSNSLTAEMLNLDLAQYGYDTKAQQ